MSQSPARIARSSIGTTEAPPKENLSPTFPILAIGFTFGLLLILYYAIHTPTYTIDSYFYLSKAYQLATGGGLHTSWNSGVDLKYFPGYSLILALSFLLGGSFVPVQILAYVVSAGVLLKIARELGLKPTEQSLSVSAFIANPAIIKWYSLPMAEGVAVTIALAAVLALLHFVKTRNSWFFILACAMGGFAVVVRAECLFLLFVFLLLLPRRHAVSLRLSFAGAGLFLLPLFIYGIYLRFSMGGNPAYISEFGYTLAHFSILKNLLYNLWAPFGLMHWPKPADAHQLFPFVVSAAAIWLLIGGMVFWGGAIAALSGRLASPARASAVLFLLYAAMHSLWYYRYERFLLLALPATAIVWAISLNGALNLFGKNRGRLLLFAQALFIASGLTLGAYYSSAHARLLQQDTSWLNFREIAGTINILNEDSGKAVLTDLGPQLAYYIREHSYLDDSHGNYWRRAFPPERTMDGLDRLGIGLVVTRRNLEQWSEQHFIPADRKVDFIEISGIAPGVYVLRYQPTLSDS